MNIWFSIEVYVQIVSSNVLYERVAQKGWAALVSEMHQRHLMYPWTRAFPKLELSSCLVCRLPMLYLRRNLLTLVMGYVNGDSLKEQGSVCFDPTLIA